MRGNVLVVVAISVRIDYGAGHINVERIVAGEVFSVSRFSASYPNKTGRKPVHFTKNVKSCGTRKFKPASRDALPALRAYV
jgi:hypothetical protein